MTKIKTAAIALAGAIACTIIGGAIGFKIGENNANTSGTLTEYLNIGNFTSNGMSLAYAAEVSNTDYDIVYGEENVAVVNAGTWYYWNDQWNSKVNVSNAKYDVETDTARFTYNTIEGNCWYGMQIFYENATNATGTTYTLTCVIAVETECEVTINDQVVSLSAGTNDITLTYIESADSSFSLQMGVEAVYMVTANTISISGLKFEKFKEVSNGGEESPAVKRLTATVNPKYSGNAILDWHVSWKNASSTWAKGKTVTDYVTVTPTSDGALTADVECLQAFGEQIIITANVRGYDNIKATCTVDYRNKITGSTYYLECTDPSNADESLIIWFLSTTDTYVDFIPTLLEYGDTFDDIWSQKTYLYASASSNQGVGTLPSEIQSYSISVAATQEYLNAFTFGGYSVTASSEIYKNLITGAPDSDLRIAFTDILFTHFVSNFNSSTADMLNKFLNYLHEHSNSVMLRMKVSCTALEGGNTVRYDTVYNLKFNSSSTENKILVTSVGGLENLVFQ